MGVGCWGWGLVHIIHSIRLYFISHFNLNTQCLGLNQGRFNDGIQCSKIIFQCSEN